MCQGSLGDWLSPARERQAALRAAPAREPSGCAVRGAEPAPDPIPVPGGCRRQRRDASPSQAALRGAAWALGPGSRGAGVCELVSVYPGVPAGSPRQKDRLGEDSCTARRDIPDSVAHLKVVWEAAEFCL